jgi:hypothetical protein
VGMVGKVSRRATQPFLDPACGKQVCTFYTESAIKLMIPEGCFSLPKLRCMVLCVILYVCIYYEVCKQFETRIDKLCRIFAQAPILTSKRARGLVGSSLYFMKSIKNFKHLSIDVVVVLGKIVKCCGKTCLYEGQSIVRYVLSFKSSLQYEIVLCVKEFST